MRYFSNFEQLLLIKQRPKTIRNKPKRIDKNNI